MQGYKLVLISLILGTISCNQDPADKPSAGSSDIQSKFTLICDTFILPANLQDAHCAGSFVDEKLGDVLIFKDLNTQIITTFSIQNLRVIDTIHIRSEHVRSAIELYRDVRHYLQWYGPDTLIFMDDMPEGERSQSLTGYAISSDSVFLKVPLGDLSNPKLGDLFGRASNYLQTNWRHPKIITSAYTDFSKLQFDHLRSLVIGQHHLIDSTVQLVDNMNFPFLEKSHDYSFLTEYYMVYNTKENAYLLGSSLTPKLHLFHLDEAGKVVNTLKAEPLSKHYQALPPPPEIIDGKMDYDYLEEVEITAYAGGKFLYHPEMNIYFRFFENPQELESSEGHYSSYQDKEYGLMVLDHDLNLMGECLLGPKSIQASTSARMVSRGMAYVTRLNKPNRELILISLKNDSTDL